MLSGLALRPGIEGVAYQQWGENREGNERAAQFVTRRSGGSFVDWEGSTSASDTTKRHLRDRTAQAHPSNRSIRLACLKLHAVGDIALQKNWRRRPGRIERVGHAHLIHLLSYVHRAPVDNVHTWRLSALNKNSPPGTRSPVLTATAIPTLDVPCLQSVRWLNS